MPVYFAEHCMKFTFHGFGGEIRSLLLRLAIEEEEDF